MSYYTFLLVTEATVEGADAGKAAEGLSSALREHAGLLYGDNGQVIGYLQISEPCWWPARPVEGVVIERKNATQKPRRRGVS